MNTLQWWICYISRGLNFYKQPSQVLMFLQNQPRIVDTENMKQMYFTMNVITVMVTVYKVYRLQVKAPDKFRASVTEPFYQCKWGRI